MATYMAVGDDGTIVCKGDGGIGDQTSGTAKHLRGVARVGINRTNGAPLTLAVGDGGVYVRLVGDGQWQILSTGTSRGLKSVSFAAKTRTAWVAGDEGEVLRSADEGATWAKGTRGSKHLNAVA